MAQQKNHEIQAPTPNWPGQRRHPSEPTNARPICWLFGRYFVLARVTTLIMPICQPRPLPHSPRSLGPHRFIGDPQYILPRASIESSRSNEEPRPSVVSDRAMGMIAPRSSPLPTRPEAPFQIATPPGTCYNCGAVPSSGTIPLGVQLTQAGFSGLAPYVSALEVVGIKHVGHIQLLLKWGEADRAAVCTSIPPNLITPLGRILLEGILNDAGRLKTEKGTNDMQRIKPTGCQIHPLPSMAGVSASLQSFMAARGIEELTPTFVIAGIKTDNEFRAFSTLTEEDKIRVFSDSRSIKLNPLQTVMVKVAFKGTEYL
ncbi:hypothetical protein BD779DRAFT_1670177 [Infundibulicybe gibba]|nr:hypothetical protein BD779DRAFT_1670177 [Infundibulicybe gibba]